LLRTVAGRVLPKYSSEWTTEKLNAESVNVLPKANVEGASLEDNKVPLILNNGRKVNSYFNTCFVSDVN
jgi:programmed cell death 8 (apoptosis-inducing factor)